MTSEYNPHEETEFEEYFDSSDFWNDEKQILDYASQQFKITREVQEHVDGEFFVKYPKLKRKNDQEEDEDEPHEYVKNRKKRDRRRKLEKLVKVLYTIDDDLAFDIENDFNDYLSKRGVSQLEFSSLVFRLKETVQQMIPKLENPEGKPSDKAYKVAFDILYAYLEKNKLPIPFKAHRQSKKPGVGITEKERSFQFLLAGLQHASGNKGDLTSKVENLLKNHRNNL